jgi:hypothetical protein
MPLDMKKGKTSTSNIGGRMETTVASRNSLGHRRHSGYNLQRQLWRMWVPDHADGNGNTFFTLNVSSIG